MRRLPILVAVFLAVPACRAPEGAPPPLDEPFRVLLLGDSISIGYTPFVQSALEGRADVQRPMRGDAADKPENCAGTNNGVEHLERWLAIDGGGWDVIHFNFGLHDLKRVQPDSGKNSHDPDHPHQADPARYGAQLRRIVDRLQQTDARLVFATTTPVPEGDLRPYREPADAVEYNAIAVRVMEQEGVPINDLFGLVLERGLSRPGDVHFSADGSRVLGEAVAEAILVAAGREGLSVTR